MKNKIEEQVLKLIDEIDNLQEIAKIRKESAPKGKGWEKTVKGMKKHKDISNPFALANWMKKKGYKPKTSESVDPSGDHRVSPEEYDKRIAAIKAVAAAAKPGSKLANDAPRKVSNLEKQRQRAAQRTTGAGTDAHGGPVRKNYYGQHPDDGKPAKRSLFGHSPHEAE